VDHLVLEDQEGEECHVEALAEQCAVELHVEDWDGATLPEVHHLVGVDHLRFLTEEARLPVLGPLREGHQGCSPPQLFPTSNTKFPLRHRSPKLMAMMIILNMKNPTQSLPMRDMIAIIVSNLHLRTLSITITDMERLRKHHMSHMLKMIGTTRGPALGLEAKPPQPGSRRDPIESIRMEDTERLLVESCYGNCLRL